MEYLRHPAVQLAVSVAAVLVVAVAVGRWWFSGSEFPPPEVLAATALSDQPEEEREKAAEVLARHPDRPLAQLKRVAAESESPRVRAAAVLGLGALRDWESMPLLIEALESPSVFLRERAASAVRQILNRDFGFRARGGDAERRQAVETIKRCWPVHHKLHLHKQEVLEGKET